MNKYLDMDDDCKELEDYSTKSIVDNCSFKAVNVEGKIVGVLLNGIVKKPVSISAVHSPQTLSTIHPFASPHSHRTHLQSATPMPVRTKNSRKS